MASVKACLQYQIGENGRALYSPRRPDSNPIDGRGQGRGNRPVEVRIDDYRSTGCHLGARQRTRQLFKYQFGDDECPDEQGFPRVGFQAHDETCQQQAVQQSGSESGKFAVKIVLTMPGLDLTHTVEDEIELD